RRLVEDLYGRLSAITADVNTLSAASGEANTASNAGSAGVGVFDSKSGVDLRFRNINAASTKLSVALDAGNKKIDLDVVEASLTLSNLGGTLSVAKGGTGSNLSATGGASQVLKQTSVGGAVTVAQLAFSDISG